MPICKSCNAKVLRTDAFCGTCGEPVPGAKPVVPIARPTRPSGTQAARDRLSGTFPPSGTGSSARAMAVVALSEPEEADPPRGTAHQTAIREREQSEPASVLPLQRRKEADGTREATAAAPEPPTPEAGAPASSGDASMPNKPVPAAPPILASDLLREQMRPSCPGQKSLRIGTVVLCGLGAVGALLAGGGHPLTFVAAAFLLMMATLALTPMSYPARAISLFVTGTVATGVALWQQTLHGIAPDSVILASATVLLAGSLLFRAYYRGARLSRFAVALGVAVLAAWFVSSEGHQSLVMLEGHWQSWAPAITHMMFGLLALLSLMAFMESSTRGGSHVWAVALLGLYAVHIALLIASEALPRNGVIPTIEGPTIGALLTGMVGTLVAALALAQVLVVGYQAASRRKSAH